MVTPAGLELEGYHALLVHAAGNEGQFFPIKKEKVIVKLEEPDE